MEKRQKVEVPVDNYGRVYIGMLESDLSAHAKLCYGVMWSFGSSGCWASIDSIAKRMSSSRPTVVKAQRELQGGGWIVLAEKGSVHSPHTWKMVVPAGNDVATSQIQQATTLPPSRQPGLLLAGNDVATKKEVKQEAKEITIAGEVPSSDLKAALKVQTKVFRDFFWKAFEKRFGRKPVFPPFKWLPKVEADLVGQLGADELCRRAGNYFKDGYVQAHSYQHFLQNVDRFYQYLEKRVVGPKGEFDRKPRGQEAVPDSVASLAKSWSV